MMSAGHSSLRGAVTGGSTWGRPYDRSLTHRGVPEQGAASGFADQSQHQRAAHSLENGFDVQVAAPDRLRLDSAGDVNPRQSIEE